MEKPNEPAPAEECCALNSPSSHQSHSSHNSHLLSQLFTVDHGPAPPQPFPVDFRQYPIPAHPWVMHQRWHDLLFAHWPVAYDQLRPLIPSHLELDRFEGECWVGVVPFWMSNVRPRYVPSMPGMSTFLELNVRTYVSHRGKPGVFFFSLDASNRIAVQLARTFFHLPYFHARMSMSGGGYPGAQSASADPETIMYSSRRIHPKAIPGQLEISYRSTSPPVDYTSDALARWLTARYCLYTFSPKGALFCGEIHHDPWPLQQAEAEIRVNTMAEAAGIKLPDLPPVLHFSERIDVQIWALSSCSI